VRLWMLTFIKATLKCINYIHLPENIMDRYTKTILTVIAVALVAIAAQNAITPAKAVGGGCGRENYNPCWVKLVN